MEKAIKSKINKKWYIIQVYSGSEEFVKNAIMTRIRNLDKNNYFGHIVIPTKQTLEAQKKKNTLPGGYVLIEVILTEKVWHFIKQIPNVIGFVSTDQTYPPKPITIKKLSILLTKIEESKMKSNLRIAYEVGEMIRIKKGPFSDFAGKIENINYVKNRFRVSIVVFGRSTMIDLEFSQVEKE